MLLLEVSSPRSTACSLRCASICRSIPPTRPSHRPVEHAADCLLRSKPGVSVGREITLLDVVALLQDLPKARLQRGQLGTVVEMLAPDVYEVELSGDDGQTYASLSVP